MTWIPDLVTLTESEGNWNVYLEKIYALFKEDFVYLRPDFRDQKVILKKYPTCKGKEATFWHLISEGKVEDDRIPDLRRCERIRWPRATIENETRPEVKVWENRRGSESRVVLWLENREYLVVLARRSRYYILWTAYTVTRSHQKAKLEREFRQYIKAGGV